MNMMNPQINADLPIRRDAPPSQLQPQAEQGRVPSQPVHALEDDAVGAGAQGQSDTFEVSMDDWFKA